MTISDEAAAEILKAVQGIILDQRRSLIRVFEGLLELEEDQIRAGVLMLLKSMTDSMVRDSETESGRLCANCGAEEKDPFDVLCADCEADKEKMR